MSRRLTTGASAASWRSKNGYDTTSFHLQPKVLPEVKAGMGREALLQQLQEGDHATNSDFLRGGRHGFQALGIGGSHDRLRSYAQISEAAEYKSTDKRYWVLNEGDGTFSIGFAFHYNKTVPRQLMYSSEFIPAIGWTLKLKKARVEAIYTLTISGVIAGPLYRGATCTVTGDLMIPQVQVT